MPAGNYKAIHGVSRSGTYKLKSWMLCKMQIFLHNELHPWNLDLSLEYNVNGKGKGNIELVTPMSYVQEIKMSDFDTIRFIIDSAKDSIPTPVNLFYIVVTCTILNIVLVCALALCPLYLTKCSQPQEKQDIEMQNLPPPRPRPPKSFGPLIILCHPPP